MAYVCSTLEVLKCWDGSTLTSFHSDKLEARVEALIQRKEQRGLGELSRRERSVSFVSTVPSRAPSDFFKHADSGLILDSAERRFTVLSPGKSKLSSRRIAWSAEPAIPQSNNFSRFLRPKQNTAKSTLLARTSSLDNPSGPPPPLKTATSFVTNQPGSLYPSLAELAQSMRPLKQLPIRGQKIAAAVHQFEGMGSERLPIAFAQPQKRKAMSEEPTSTDRSKRLKR